MTDEDFLLDRKSLIGTKVAVSGHLSIKGDLTFIILADESNATFVDIDGLPRDVRKEIHQRCKERCSATIVGTTKIVQSVFGPDVGISADSISIP